MKILYATFLSCLLATGVVGCQDDNLEDAGDNLEDAAEDTGDAIEDACDEATDDNC